MFDIEHTFVGGVDILRDGGGRRMLTVEVMRERARECREKAQAATTDQEKAKWQELADSWTQLVEQGIVAPPDSSTL